MGISEAARDFAIKAHKGQFRKGEPDKPFIIHPIGVAKILEDYGYDDYVVAAGYLHDVVEDTKYTIEDIRANFGVDVANLVLSATEPDKNLPWEERKKHTIQITKGLPLRNKALICADKINNLEASMILFAKNNRIDFSKFKRGLKEQMWYYTSVYESLIQNENPNLPIFKRLKDVIDIVFRDKENYYLRDTIFGDNADYYKQLKMLHAAKLELEQLKSYVELDSPFIIEFSGTPRTGKTSIINNLSDFFKKGGFKVKVLEEFVSSEYYKRVIKPKLEHYSIGDSNLIILDCVLTQLVDASRTKNDIVIIDRSISDRQIWNKIRCKNSELSTCKYLETLNTYMGDAKRLIDYLFLLYTDALTSLRRDYSSSLALEPRTFLNAQNINEFNNSMYELLPVLSSSVKNISLVNTTSNSVSDNAIKVASDVMPVIRKRYLDSFNKKYN